MPETRELNYRDALAGHVAADMPVIDGRALATHAWAGIVSQARTAARQHGFLCIDLAPAQQHLVRDCLAQAIEFFALPDEQKAAVRDQGAESGWTPSYEEPAYQPGTVSNVESFDIEKPLVDEPDDSHWPDVPGFRTSVTDYWRGMKSLADDILELMARTAGIEPRFFAERCDSGRLNTLRLLHYPGNPTPPDPTEVGIAAHTDFECITLLYQTAPGLELRSMNGQWLEAPAESGRLIVLLDDMLERWTNGYFQATGHRVRRTPGRRHSLVMFIAVNDEVEVAPLPGFVSDGDAPRYAPTGQAEHIETEMARSRAQMHSGQGA